MMKKTIKMLTALVLASMLVLTSVAAPAVADTAQSTNEETAMVENTEAAAELAKDVTVVGTEETVIAEYNFNSETGGWTVVGTNANTNKAEYDGSITQDGYYEIHATCDYGQYPDGSEWLNSNGSLRSHTDCRIASPKLDFDTANVTKVEIRFNDCGNGDRLNLHYDSNGSGITSKELLAYKYEKTTDWVTATFDFTSANLTANWKNKLTGFRLAILGSGKKNESVYVDYIKIYGYESNTYGFLPGYNIITGTENAYDFNSLSHVDLKKETTSTYYLYDNGEGILYTNYPSAIVDSPVAATDGNVLKMSALGNTEKNLYPQVHFKAHKAPTDGRPVFVSYDMLIWNADNWPAGQAKFNWAMFADGKNSGSALNLKKVYKSTETPAWQHCTYKDVNSGTKGLAALQTVTPKNEYTYDYYYDNIMFVPYYKVTFMDGDTVLATEWVLDDGSGNILEYVDPASVFNGTYPEGTNAWSLTKDGDAVDAIKLNNEDIVVYAVYRTNFKPGINLLTGTEEALDFSTGKIAADNKSYQNENGKTLLKLNGYASLLEITDSLVTGVEGDKALRIDEYYYYGASTATSVSTYPTVKSDVGLPNDGRPVYVAADVLSNNTDYTTRSQIRFGVNGTNGTIIGGGNTYRDINTFKSTDTSKSWSRKFVMDNESTTSLASFVFNINANTKYLKLKENENNKWIESDAMLVSPELYMDNVVYIPYYKVTYKNADTVLATEWVLHDEDGNILEEFNPCDFYEGEYPAGTNAWSLTNGGESVDTIALENKDIVVYASFKVKNNDNIVYALEFDDDYNPNDISDHTFSRISRVSVKGGKLSVAANIPSAVMPDNSAYKWDAILGYKDLQLTGSSVKSIEMRVKFFEADMALEATYLTDPETGEIVFETDKNGNVTTKPAIDTEYPYEWRKDTMYTSGSHVGYHGTLHGTKVDQEYTASGTPLTNKTIEYFFQIQGNSSSYYQSKTKDLSSFTVDEEGYTIVKFDIATDMLYDTNVDVWNNNEISYFRIDLPSVCCAAEIDYIRFIGESGESFVPTKQAPEKRAGNSIKLDEDSAETGIRFKAAIRNDVKSNSDLTEYGWLVALAETLGTEELTHQFKSKNGKTAYVKGVAYGYDENGKKVDRVFDIEDAHTIFTAVVVGIPAEKANMEIVIRPYSVVNGAYVYGSCVVISPREVAQKLYNDYIEKGCPEDHDYALHSDFIDSLGIVK